MPLPRMRFWGQNPKNQYAVALAPSASVPDSGTSSPAPDRVPEATKPRTFVLIHGSWHDGGCWDTVANLLRAKGHTVYTPTVYGHGCEIPPLDAGFEKMAAGVVQEFVDRNLRNVVLVGWSFGGPVVQAIYSMCPERISEVIILDGFVLRDGESILEVITAANPEAPAMFQSFVNPETQSISLPFDMFTYLLMPAVTPNGTPNLGVTPELQRQVWESLHPELWAPIEEHLKASFFWYAIGPELSAAYAMQLQVAYIVATEDLAFGTTFWRDQAAKLGPSCHVFEVPGVHELMYSDPEALTRAILQAAYFSVPA